MGLQASASKTGLLLNCQWPFGEQIAIEPGEASEPANYGSGFHSLMEVAPLGVGEKFDETFPRLVDAAGETFDLNAAVREELAGHVKGSLGVLQRWLAGKNPWDYKFDTSRLERETSYAIRIKPGGLAVKVRRIASPTAEAHVYEEAEKKEIPGTVDLMEDSPLRDPDGLSLVMDYKSGVGVGENFERPSKHPQLKTLSLIPDKEPIVAIFHADRRGLPIIYAEEISQAERASHARKVHRALSRRNSGYMRPGEWCKRCPARSVCPTQTAELLAGAASLVNGGHDTLVRTAKASAMTTPAIVGQLHQFFAEFDRLKEQARPLMKAKVKEWLAENQFSMRPDGKQLVIKTRTEERISKGKIVEALGAPEAERLFQKLRKAGALETTESEGLYAQFPD
jgi:PD-(D/E)XK nuclease superfamily